MTETVQLALLGGLATWLMHNTYVIFKVKSDVRVLIAVVGKRAAIAFHSPNDHWGLDKLVEKFQNGCEDAQDMQLFFDRMIEVEQDVSVHVKYRVMARIVLLCAAKHETFKNFNLGDREKRRKEVLK